MRGLAAALAVALALPAMAQDTPTPITRESARAWSFLSDRVMGGVSTGEAAYGEEDGRGFLRLTGEVSTENRGGFVQMRRPVTVPSGAQGVVLVVRGNGPGYAVHLRTRGPAMPWQFHQALFEAPPDWREVRIPFSAFRPKGDAPALRPERIDSLGVAAWGADFRADVSVAGTGFY